jgi:hypothetical protein
VKLTAIALHEAGHLLHDTDSVPWVTVLGLRCDEDEGFTITSEPPLTQWPTEVAIRSLMCGALAELLHLMPASCITLDALPRARYAATDLASIEALVEVDTDFDRERLPGILREAIEILENGDLLGVTREVQHRMTLLEPGDTGYWEREPQIELAVSHA